MAKIIVNCGIVPVRFDNQDDGVITFGKHTGQKLSDEDVTYRYLSWAYAWLESHNLPENLVHVLELVWYWGDRKFDEAKADGGTQTDDREFDELVDEARIGMDEAFEAESKARESRGWGMTYDYDPDRDNWDVVPVGEKRRRERERARKEADKVMAEAVSASG